MALAWYNLGLMQWRRGDLGGPQAYGRALALDPNNAECHQNNAGQLLGGNIDAARSFIRAISLLQQQGRADAAEQLRRRCFSW